MLKPPFYLRCEYLKNPIGINAFYPRFSWKLKHEERSQAQSAFHIIISSDLKTSESQIGDLRSQKTQIERDQRKLLENFTRLQDKIQNPDDAYSISLKKAEIAASAKLACAYLGIQQEFNFDRDIPMSEIIKYEEELSNM